MSGGELEWMKSFEAPALQRPKRASIRVGISEVFFGERGRQIDFVRDAARLIESIGYDEVWLPEHVVWFQSYESKYPYGDTGAREIYQTRQEEGNPGSRGLMDAAFVAVAAAAVTTRLRFGTFISILPQRNPVVYAREIATADQLTGGRLDMGVGVGWAREEYEACQVPFEKRGDRMDEYVEAMKELWTAEVSSYSGQFVSFKPLLAYPKPLQTPYPPLLIGGNSLRAISRAAQHGDGIIVYDLAIAQLEKIISVLDKELTSRGRSIDDFRIVTGRRNEGRTQQSWDTDAEFIDDCKKLGVITDVVCAPRFSNDGYADNMSAYARTVLSAR